MNEIFQLQSNLNGIDTKQLRLDDVFADRKAFYINELDLFIAYFKTIPNAIYESGIDCIKANYWFLQHYKAEIRDIHYSTQYFQSAEQTAYDYIVYVLYEDLIVSIDTMREMVKFFFRKTNVLTVETIIKGFKTHKKRRYKRKPRISVLVNSRNDIDTRSLTITKLKLNINDNYNDDFQAIHQIIYKRLSQKNDKGLVLLHGKPGTGKTSYIRYLVYLLKKEVIFLPPSMAANITHYSLISILIYHPNSIFVIEDAENIVVDREKDGNSPVSALLNISDGLLSDCLNIQIICSFNTDISKIDNALMRKGRLIAKYEFKELETEKAKMLSQKLGFSTKIDSPMTLSEIYNQSAMGFADVKKDGIGFRVRNK